MVKRLTVCLVIPPQNPRDGSAIEPKLGEILEALRDITQPERKHVKFPWKENLRVRDPYYPHVMEISLRNREASLDKKRMGERIEKLEQNRTGILVTKLLSQARKLIPPQWPLNQLQPVNPKEGQIRVYDFPLELKSDSKELAASVRTFPTCEIVFVNSNKRTLQRVARNAVYRIMCV
jgi:hypothetical protein